MTNVRLAFEVKVKETKIDPGRSYLNFHPILGIKMDFTRKARFVANGSTTPITSASTYTGVVSIETVRIAFIYEDFNGLDIMAADI